MSDTIIVALISGLGTAAGAVVSVLTANRITNFKIERLEEEVKKHNSIIERTFKLEEKTAVMDEQIKVANHRIEDLEREAKK